VGKLFYCKPVTDWCGFNRDLLSEDIAYTPMDEKVGGPVL
jgi:hypothetical protein